MTHRIAASLVVELLAAGDALARRSARRLASERGQGTVEYVALILLVAGVLAAVVTWARRTGDSGIGAKVVGALKESIESVGGGR